MEEIKVSVVIPVYNGEKFIESCIDSVLNQTYKNIEIIVINDGSTDKSLEIINDKYTQISVYNQKNGDVAKARNAGIALAQGDYIALLDQDDYWMENKIELQVKAIIENNFPDVCFTNLKKINSKGKEWMPEEPHQIALSLTPLNTFEKLAIKNCLMPSAVMIKKETINKYGAFDDSFRTCGDYELWLRYAGAGAVFIYCPEQLTVYRLHNENNSYKTDLMRSDRLKAVETAFDSKYLKNEYKSMKNISLAFAYKEAAYSYFSSKNYKKFLDETRQAIALSAKVLDFKFLSRYFRALIKS